MKLLGSVSRLWLLVTLLLATMASGATTSPLFSRGYTVLPSPQSISFQGGEFEFTSEWRLQSSSATDGDFAITELQRLLSERFSLKLEIQAAISNAPAVAANAGRLLRLTIVPDSVQVTAGADRDKAALARQAYRLALNPNQVVITGNTATGLFYGVQTFVQLLKEQRGKVWLPQAVIEDWPDTELRVLYWDDAHHLEHLDVLKAALREAAFYKINGFSIKLEGHFQYAHARAIVDPYALSPSELQDLTDYGLKYHVQLIPYLDGPGHDAFILKHPEYASLREYPDSNYEFCTTNPKTYELFQGMFDDLLAANKGGKYFVLSSDEPYYVGLANNTQCREAEGAKQVGSVGKQLAEFITKTANYLHDRGRTVVFWGEYPLKPEDISALPDYLINGEVYGPQFDPVFRSHGIRQMVYTYTEAEEPLFPQYYLLPSSLRLHPSKEDSGGERVSDMLESISLSSLSDLFSTRPGSARSGQADLLGVLVAGWADAGLHPETFWLGYATGLAGGWNASAASPQEMQSSFYALFYGREATGMGRLYQLMSEGAQTWEDSWETGPSAARKPIWGDSYEIFHARHPARDQYLPPLPVPSSNLLTVPDNWVSANHTRLDLAAKSLAENDELLDLLYTNIRGSQFHSYNLEVFLSIGDIFRQNLAMIEDLGRISSLLEQAQETAAKGEPAKALELIDRGLDTASGIRNERNQTLANAAATWYQSWYPRVSEANGRTFLHELDDVKDHRPDRTVDMSYLIYRELLYPLDKWAEGVVASRNDYAAAHHLPHREFTLDWKNTSAVASSPPNNTK